MNVYRFRSMDNLLGEHQELKKQEIYFAGPGDLNDPMEGLREIVWCGDKIVWENFFKHYVFCLYATYFQYLAAGPFMQLTVNNIPMLKRWDKLPSPAQSMFNEIWERFVNLPKIPKFIESLAHTNREIRYRELKRYLKTMHFALLDVIKEVYVANGHISQPTILHPNEDLSTVGERLESMLAAMTQLEADQDQEKFNAVLGAAEGMDYRTRLELQLNNVIPEGMLWTNFQLVFCDFHDIYLKETEKLLWFNWRTACFTQDYHNSVDFFRSIGRATVEQVRELWYTDEEGHVSECAAHLPRDGEIDNDDTITWPKRYWDNFYHDITSKTKNWKDEQEWRLILEDRSGGFLEEKNHKLIYDFHCLKGIIWGMRTSLDHTSKIIKIIQKKCKKHKRTDFKFYQAYYSPETDDIRKYEILLPWSL